MKILIVKTSALGDLIHCFPVVSYLRKKFPHAKIEWVVEKAGKELLESHPHIERVHVIDTKRWRKQPFSSATRKEYRQFLAGLDTYDVVFDLQGNVKSAWVTWKAKSSDKVGFARDSVPEWPNLFATNRRYNPPAGNNIRDDYIYLVRSYFGDFETGASQQVVLRSSETKYDFTSPCYMVCPGSAWPNKQLHPVALKRFLSRLQDEKGCNYLFVWGCEKERLFAEELQEELGGQLAPKLSLSELQALMRAVDLVVAMDSLPLHLAGTTDTPTLSVFGPSVSEKYRPIGSQHQAIQGSCPYGRSFEKRCPVLRSCSTGACIRGIDGDTLFETLS